MGCLKKPLEGNNKEAALLYAVLRFLPKQIGFRKEFNKEQDIQALIDAAAAVAHQITNHTGSSNIPNAILTNADSSRGSSLSDISSPTTNNNNCKQSTTSHVTIVGGSLEVVKKCCLTSHQAQQKGTVI